MKKRLLSLILIFSMVVTLVPITGKAAETTLSNTDLAKLEIDAIVEKSPTIEKYVLESADDVIDLGELLPLITNSLDISILDAYAAKKTKIGQSATSTYSTVASFYKAYRMQALKSQIAAVYADAPTAGRYSETTAILMDNLKVLGNGLDTSDTLTADTYVATVCATQGKTLAAFISEYDAIGETYFEKKAEEIDVLVQALLAKPLVREEYEKVRNQYDVSSERTKAKMDIENINSLNSLKEFFELADKSVAANDKISVLTGEAGYANFTKEVLAAETAYSVYVSKFTSLRSLTKFGNYCLTKDMKDTFVENAKVYHRSKVILDVEQAYDAVGSFTVLTEDIEKKIEELSRLYKEAANGIYTISVYDYYNGPAIRDLVEKYEHVKQFFDLLSVVPDTISNTTELAVALRAFSYYSDTLTDEEREMIDAGNFTKLTDVIDVSTNYNDIIKAIDNIGVATKEDEYVAYLERYEDAYIKYQSFINQYSNIAGIEGLVTNVDILNNETIILEVIDSIRTLLGKQPMEICTYINMMDKVELQYNELSEVNKEHVYNYSEFATLYADAKAAYNIVSRINTLSGSFTLDDEGTFEKICEDYENLNDTAKSYVNTNFAVIQSQFDALNQNEANKVIDAIERIGTVTARSKDRINAAITAYNALSVKQRKLVSNYTVLTAAITTYKALDLNVANAEIPTIRNYSYTGLALTPAITVKLNGEYLKKDIDYTVSYANNRDKGTATIMITGIGYYTGTVTRTFTITAQSLDGLVISGLKKQYVYTGKMIKPALTLKMGAAVLKENVHYTISYKDNAKVGTATFTIKGKDDYVGTITGTFTISKCSIKKAKVTKVANMYRRTGKAVKPVPKVKVNGITLKKGTDYKLTYKKNKKKGKATIIITGKGNYTGKKKVNFLIY